MTPAQSPSSPTRQAVFRVVLHDAVPPTLVVGALAAVVLGILRGWGGGLSAAVGVLIAVAFFGSGLLVMARFVVDTSNPMLFMAVGMATYFAQVILLLGVIIVSSRINVFDTQAAGVAILVCVVVWQLAQMRGWRRAKVPLYDDVALPGDVPTGPSGGSS